MNFLNRFKYLILIALLSGCSFKDFFKKEPPVDQAEYARLDAEVNRTWDALVRSNERRMRLTDQVLTRIPEGNLGQIQKQTRQLTPSAQSLRARKADYQVFDSLQTLMLNALVSGQEANDTALVRQIRIADDSVLTYRLFYDKAADRYNQYLTEHKKGLARQTGKTYEELRKPLFRLME